MDFTTILGLVAACLTTGALIPQSVKVIRTKSTEDLSLWMFLLMFTGLWLWLIYGLLLWQLPIIFANTFAIIFSSIILFYKLKEVYRASRR
ncbi:MAG: SemiSWEET transporter [Bacteroidota bacterium]